ncbi:20697_t:CDS:2, partial [Gigaspora rosea]
MIQNKYCSTLIDVQKITKNIRVSTQFGHSISKQFGSSTLELPDNINDL